MPFTPVAPVVIPTFTQDRGPISFDPLTKSTLNDVTLYAVQDACGADAYQKVGFSMSINQNDANCQNGLAASVSVSMLLPITATDADVDTLINKAASDIKARFPLT